MAALAAFLCYQSYHSAVIYQTISSISGVFFVGYLPLSFVIAAFSSFFIGSEYSDGTLRNKLIVGSLREKIYLANFITVAACGLMMLLAYLGVCLAMGLPLLGGFLTDISTVLQWTGLGILLTLASAALITLLCMHIPNLSLIHI